MIRLGVRAAALILLSVGCGAVVAQVAPSPDTETLAVVGDRTISRARFEREMERRGAGLPGQYATPDERRALLDELIRREYRKGWTLPVPAAVSRVR